MRTPTTVLALALLSASGRAGLLEAQTARDVCPLAVRMSSARPETACLDARTLPFVDGAAAFDRPAPPGGNAALTLGLLGARLALTQHSGYPVDRNDGALWSGHGWSSGASFGAWLRTGPLTVAVEPTVTWSQNRSLSLPDTTVPGLSRFAYPWAYGRLDWYLRPGSGRLIEFDPGESFAELSGGGVRAGVSNERFWWGPARRYPLLFSGTAPGFPHAYVGTAGYRETPLGGIGFEVLWGRLQESRWFDADPRNDQSLLGALQLRWRSDFVPGLEMSYALARHEPLPNRKLESGQLVQLFTGDPDTEDPGRRGTPMGTLSIRFAYPEAGFEAYAQVGRGEGFLVPVPGVSETRVSQVYLMGMTRTDTLPSGRRWRLAAEVVKQTLELPQPSADGGAVQFVDGGPAWKGHTNQGQVLGAYTGPASNAQYLAADLLGARGMLGVFAERVRRDDDTYFRSLSPDYGFRGHDVEWTLGLRGGRTFDRLPAWASSGPLALGSELGVSRRKNRLYTGLDRINRAFLREWNLSLDVWVRWRAG